MHQHLFVAILCCVLRFRQIHCYILRQKCPCTTRLKREKGSEFLHGQSIPHGCGNPLEPIEFNRRVLRQSIHSSSGHPRSACQAPCTSPFFDSPPPPPPPSVLSVLPLQLPINGRCVSVSRSSLDRIQNSTTSQCGQPIPYSCSHPRPACQARTHQKPSD